MTLEIPEGCYSDQELGEIREIIFDLNAYTKMPVTKFEWLRQRVTPNLEVRFDHYDALHHTIALSHQPITAPQSPRIEWTKTVLAHEMGHAIFHKRFLKDASWGRIYYYGLRLQNDEAIYEIVDDSNYLGDSSDDVGHPSDDASEAFASSIHAYFLHADRFAAYIRNPRTPESMRTFGRLIWAYMREKVFRGSVFTSDGIDPFAGDPLETLMTPMPTKRESLIALFRHSDVMVRTKLMNAFSEAALYHQLNLPSRWTGDWANEVPALIMALEDKDGNMRRSAIYVLEEFGPAAKEAIPALVECLQDGDARIREAAAIALKSASPKAAAWVPELFKVSQNGDSDASKSAYAAVKKLLNP